MSVHLLGRAFYADLPAHLKLTLLALCDEASEDGSSICVGQVKLARKVGATDRTVRSNLAELDTRGWVNKLPERHPKYRTDQYEIVVEMLPAGPEDVAAQEVEDVSGEAEEPEVQRKADRKSSVAHTGSPLPATQLLPVTPTRSATSFDSEATRLCEVLRDLLVANGVKRVSISDSWRNEAERMLRIDQRDPAEAEQVLRWSQTDPFWRANVLSMPKFREKYDQLRLKMTVDGSNSAMNRHLARAASRSG